MEIACLLLCLFLMAGLVLLLLVAPTFERPVDILCVCSLPLGLSPLLECPLFGAAVVVFVVVINFLFFLLLPHLVSSLRDSRSEDAF
jgi:hypothetical protein